MNAFFANYPRLLLLLFLALVLLPNAVISQKPVPSEKKLRLGVIGLVHDHVSWILNRKKEDVSIVGIVETNRTAIARYQKRYNLHDSLFFESYEALYSRAKPEAVSAFNETKKHLEVVAFFAPRGIPIMVEKPMATSYEEALEMARLSEKHGVPLLINYETSWYESTYEAKKIMTQNKVGNLTKMVFNTGHPGPIEIGCSPEFLAWLTDPVLNGGGALTDFGCYGANIATWMLEGETPLSVSCIAKQSKPELYPKVDDDTTIVLEYEKLQVVIQASWNWSHNRKDMQIYGSQGYINSINGSDMQLMVTEKEGLKAHQPAPISDHQKDPFRLLYEVVHENRTIEQNGLYSVENNIIVSKILSLAKLASEKKQSLAWDTL
ncbi:MAG: putative dehydrogenase [Flavobacteriaceae bacterium]|jgi:predicted dehydrogenase|tara:strand:+ start:18186 stop:19319 length:1134 start_codon:yes stop_codon:yes gene_type:complete